MRPDRDAFVVGMTLVPGLFSRNRMFALFTHPEVRAARARAAQLRGAIRHLRGSHGAVEIVEFHRGSAGHAGHLHYRIPQIRLVRRLELTPAEAACVAYVCGRAVGEQKGNVGVLAPSENDRAVVEGALHRLSGGALGAALDAQGLKLPEP